MNDVIDVLTTDDSITVYQTRDLGSRAIAQVPTGHGIRLGPAKEFEGREWIEGTLADGSIGFILGPSARGHTTLGAMYTKCPYCGQTMESGTLTCRFCGRTVDAVLNSLEKQKADDLARAAAIRGYLRRRGTNWLVTAFAQFVLSAYLSAAWGLVCLALGALNLAVPRRGMLITNGVAMVVVGLGNFCATLYFGKPGMMTYLGAVQVVWGVRELRRYFTGEVKQ